MANMKASDVQPVAAEEVICVRGGRLGDRTITSPYGVVQVGEEFVRIFKIRKRDMWCIAAWMPAATPRAEVSSDILFKVQKNSRRPFWPTAGGKRARMRRSWLEKQPKAETWPAFRRTRVRMPILILTTA